jgi:hypothetical protein
MLDNCKSPEEPEKSASYYRFNVEVTYSNVAEGESDFPIFLYYGLWDLWGEFKSGSMEMTKIGANEARCYLPKVLISDPQSEGKHWVSVVDPNRQPWCHRGEDINVQGAYDQEIDTTLECSCLLFKMSKE